MDVFMFRKQMETILSERGTISKTNKSYPRFLHQLMAEKLNFENAVYFGNSNLGGNLKISISLLIFDENSSDNFDWTQKWIYFLLKNCSHSCNAISGVMAFFHFPPRLELPKKRTFNILYLRKYLA